VLLFIITFILQFIILVFIRINSYFSFIIIRYIYLFTYSD